MQASRHLLPRVATGPLVFLALFALSRMLVATLGIAPEPAHLEAHWQHADLALLKSDPIGTLWNLHSQPPLWNAVVALAVGLTNTTAQASALLHAFNLAMSIACGLTFLSVLRRMGFGAGVSVGLALTAMCTPSVIYYENFAFYPHLTFFLVVMFVACVLRIGRCGSLWPLAGALALLVLLAWTWAIFHPLFVAALGVALALMHGRTRHVWRTSTAMLVGAVLMASAPAVKNAVVYGVPSASTWAGLNLAQTDMSATPDETARCSFGGAFQAASAGAPVDGHPALSALRKQSGDPNLNHAGLIPISRACMTQTVRHIAAQPLSWFSGRIQALVRSHQLLPYNYDMDPKGWSAMQPLERMQQQLGVIGRAALLIIYLGLAIFGVRRALAGPDQARFAVLMLLLGGFTAAAHLMNGGEQERMRYTIEPVYLWLTASLMLALDARRARSLPSLQPAE